MGCDCAQNHSPSGHGECGFWTWGWGAPGAFFITMCDLVLTDADTLDMPASEGVPPVTNHCDGFDTFVRRLMRGKQAEAPYSKDKKDVTNCYLGLRHCEINNEADRVTMDYYKPCTTGGDPPSGIAWACDVHRNGVSAQTGTYCAAGCWLYYDISAVVPGTLIYRIPGQVVTDDVSLGWMTQTEFRTWFDDKCGIDKWED